MEEYVRPSQFCQHISISFSAGLMQLLMLLPMLLPSDYAVSYAAAYAVSIAQNWFILTSHLAARTKSLFSLIRIDIKEFIYISSIISFLAFHNRTMRFLSENMHFLCRIGHLLVAMLWKIACLCQLLNPIFVHGLIENPI